MDLLLDTHVLLWWDNGATRLAPTTRATIADPANHVFVSAASIWEIAIKRQAGRLAFTGSPTAAIARNGFLPLPILPAQAEHAASLPSLHSDPFDRMLVAQAQLAALVLVTSDRALAGYPVPQLFAG